jgi:hypothetical protein
MIFPGRTRGLSIVRAFGRQLVPPPVRDRSVVLVSLRLSRLRLSSSAAAALAATAAARSHAFAAVHSAVAIAVRAAVAAHRVALMLVVLTARSLRHLVPRMARLTRRRGSAVLLVLTMVLMLLCRRGSLGCGWHGERKRNRTNEDLHLNVS